MASPGCAPSTATPTPSRSPTWPKPSPATLPPSRRRYRRTRRASSARGAAAMRSTSRTTNSASRVNRPCCRRSGASRWPKRCASRARSWAPASHARPTGGILSVQVEVAEQVCAAPPHRQRRQSVSTSASRQQLPSSSGEKIDAPRPLRAALRRLRIRSRRLVTQASRLRSGRHGSTGRIAKGTRMPVSKNRTKGARALARLHARIARVRADWTHKLTTRLCHILHVRHLPGRAAGAARLQAPRGLQAVSGALRTGVSCA